MEPSSKPRPIRGFVKETWLNRFRLGRKTTFAGLRLNDGSIPLDTTHCIKRFEGLPKTEHDDEVILPLKISCKGSTCGEILDNGQPCRTKSYYLAETMMTRVKNATVPEYACFCLEHKPEGMMWTLNCDECLDECLDGSSDHQVFRASMREYGDDDLLHAKCNDHRPR